MGYLTTVYASVEVPAAKGQKKGKSIIALPKAESIYTGELERVVAGCKSAILLLRAYASNASWKEVKEQDKASVDVKAWIRSDGKIGEKSVDAAYLNRLIKSVYTCMDGQKEKQELALHRQVRSAVLTFALYGQYVGIFKHNDGLDRAVRLRTDKLDEAADHGTEFAPITASSVPVEESAASAQELDKAA